MCVRELGECQHHLCVMNKRTYTTDQQLVLLAWLAFRSIGRLLEVLQVSHQLMTQVTIHTWSTHSKRKPQNPSQSFTSSKEIVRLAKKRKWLLKMGEILGTPHRHHHFPLPWLVVNQYQKVVMLRVWLHHVFNMQCAFLTTYLGEIIDIVEFRLVEQVSFGNAKSACTLIEKCIDVCQV